MLNTLQKLMALLFKPEQENFKLQQQVIALTKQSGQLQEKLSSSLAHVTVLEGVLLESNKTIESLQLALDYSAVRDTEEADGLQDYLDELETEIDEAVELIQNYGLQMRKV